MSSAGLLQRARCSICASLILALAPCALRAQTPINPLRSGNRLVVMPTGAPAELTWQPNAEDDIWSEPTPTIRQTIAAEGEPPEPPSVVPPQFGEPETLPPPNIDINVPPGSAGFESHLGGWQDHYVHHWFD